jgi:hypothetical protein
VSRRLAFSIASLRSHRPINLANNLTGIVEFGAKPVESVTPRLNHRRCDANSLAGLSLLLCHPGIRYVKYIIPVKAACLLSTPPQQVSAYQKPDDVGKQNRCCVGFEDEPAVHRQNWRTARL